MTSVPLNTGVKVFPSPVSKFGDSRAGVGLCTNRACGKRARARHTDRQTDVVVLW